VQIGAVRICWIETGNEAVRATPQQFKCFDGVTYRFDYDLRCERKRRCYGPGLNGAIIRTERSASCRIVEKYSLNTIHLKDGISRSVARGQSPHEFIVVGKLHWILDSILPVNICSPPAVLEIIDPGFSIEVVVYAAKIQPQMRHLMNE